MKFRIINDITQRPGRFLQRVQDTFLRFELRTINSLPADIDKIHAFLRLYLFPCRSAAAVPWPLFAGWRMADLAPSNPGAVASSKGPAPSEVRSRFAAPAPTAAARCS